MWKILSVLMPSCLVAALLAGMMLAGSRGSIVEVKQELPVRAALVRQSSWHLAPAHDALVPGDDFDTLSTPDSDVLETAAKFEKFGMFVRAAKAAGLTDQLRSRGNITVFMPTNNAFAHLPRSAFEELLAPENRTALRNFVSAHIVPERVVWSDLFGRITRLTTVSGKSLVVSGADGVRVEGVRLELSDVLATNGVIHAVDRLVVPAASDPSVM